MTSEMAVPKPIVLSEDEKWSDESEITKEMRKKVGKSLGKEDKMVLEELKKLYKIEHGLNENYELDIKANQNIGSVFLPNIKREFQVMIHLVQG